MSEFPASMPHDALQEVLPGVHWMLGSVRMGPAMVLNRGMVVLEHEGELTVINAIRPSDPGELDALGRVVRVVKIGMHGMDDAWYRDHYDAPLWAAAGVEGADVVVAVVANVGTMHSGRVPASAGSVAQSRAFIEQAMRVVGR